MAESERLTHAREALRAELSDVDVIEFAVIFGSFAGADRTPASDIDLAIKFRDDLDPQARFRQLCALSGTLQSSDRPFVDVSDVEGLPLDVANDAVQGELVYGSEQQLDTFREEIQDAFEAERETIRSRQRRVIERIAEHGLHG